MSGHISGNTLGGGVLYLTGVGDDHFVYLHRWWWIRVLNLHGSFSFDDSLSSVALADLTAFSLVDDFGSGNTFFTYGLVTSCPSP